jgi:hypothetical protein
MEVARCFAILHVVVDTVEDQLQMITDGEADLAVAAITINTEREDTMDLSYPYYSSGLRIMTRSGAGQLAWNLLSLVLSPRALEIVFAFVFIMFIIGNLVWLLERKKNSEEFPQGYLKGVWEGIWWSIVTVTTVGYGDKAPVRSLAVCWVCLPFCLVSFSSPTSLRPSPPN